MFALFPFASNIPSLTTAHKHVLRTLVIDGNEPGTILHDFEAALNALEPGGITLTQGQQLPSKVAANMNSRLKHPIGQGVQRAMQKSYPPVHGLYLLLRASGLTTVEGTATKPMLKLDEKLHTQWKALSPVERLGTLLESWLIRGKTEIIGETRPRSEFIPDNFVRSAMFYIRIPDEGEEISAKRNPLDELRYYPGLHNLGLLYLFGLIDIKERKPEAGKGWNIERIHRTPFGDALFAALYHDFFETLFHRLMSEDEQIPLYGALQKPLQTYWPDFKRTLVLNPLPFRKGRYVFKISILDVWRRVAIGANATLDRLAQIILSAVEFDNDHLYSFTFKDRFGTTNEVNHPYLEDAPFTSKVRVGDLPLRVGERMVFTFDFGDNWEFTVTLEEVDPRQTIKQPAILETHGESPQQYENWDDEDDDEDWDEPWIGDT